MTNRMKLLTTASMAAGAVFALAQTATAATAAYATTGASLLVATQTVPSSGVVALGANNIRVTFNDAGATLPVNSTLTVALPAGYSWVGIPTVSAAGCGNNNNGTYSASVNANNLVITQTNGTAAEANANCVINIGANNTSSFSAGTDLSTPSTSTRNVSITINGTGTITNPTALTVQPVSGITFNATANAGNVNIDTSATSAGNLFVANGNTNTRAAQLGNTVGVSLTANARSAADGTAYALPNNLVGTLTATGSFAQANRVYALQANSGACLAAGAAVPSSGVTATVSGGTATFSGVAFTNAAGAALNYTLCYENTGSAVVQSSGYRVSGAATAVAPFTSTSADLGTTAYNGSVGTVQYVTGGSAYQYFLRVTNPTVSPSSVIVVVTRENGVANTGTITTTLGGNSNALYSIADVNAATGANLSATDRARIQIVTSIPAGSGAGIGGILFNTATGVITTAQ